MLNYILKCLEYNVILLSLIIMLKAVTSISQNNVEITNLSHVAKRSFLLKEHEFLKVKPLSDEMKSFISKYKKRSKSNLDRFKRGNNITNVGSDQMFVIQNGGIVPLNSLKSATGIDKAASSFTVVPLIIPVTVKDYSDQKNNTLEICTEDLDTSTASQIENSSIGRGQSIISDRGYIRKQNNAVFLNKVMEDIEELIKYEKEGKSLSNEGTICNTDGNWNSDAGGMQIRIGSYGNHSHVLEVNLAERPTKGGEKGFLHGEQWNFTGREPFNHSSLLVLTAISSDKKKVATFIGECRICDGIETIAGNWMLARGSKNCKDRQECHTFLSDVMKRNNKTIPASTTENIFNDFT